MVIRERFGARAVSHIAASVPVRVETLWAGMYDACHKMARVACGRYAKYDGECRTRGETPLPFADSLNTLFPAPSTPAIYLACAIRSVLKDASRTWRKVAGREALSLDDPVFAGKRSALTIGDRLEERLPRRLPEEALREQAARQERAAVVGALPVALAALSADYRAAIISQRERKARREAGEPLRPMTAPERQRLSRAREALLREIARLLGERARADNTVFQALCAGQPRQEAKRRHAAKRAPASEPWTEARQERLFRHLTEGGWARRARALPGGNVEEAVVHELNAARAAPAPGKAFRKAVRVLDRYGMKAPTPQGAQAAQQWDEARELRRAGKLEEAAAAFLACHAAEPEFVEARIAAAVTLFRLGQLDAARAHYLDIIRRCPQGAYRSVAASNLSEIYLTWFRIGRGSKELHIGEAVCYAQMGMAQPSPARAANLLLAYVADRRFYEAEAFLTEVFAANDPACLPEDLLRLLAQIRDNDLIAFWNWLEEKEEELR
jgi:hypothetical protein